MLTLFGEMRFRIFHSCFVVTRYRSTHSFNSHSSPPHVKSTERIFGNTVRYANETKNLLTSVQNRIKWGNYLCVRFIQVTNCLFLHRSHHCKFVFETLIGDHLNIWMAVKRATIIRYIYSHVFASCYTMFLLRTTTEPKVTKSSTIIAGNIVRTNLYPEILIAPSNHSCGRSRSLFHFFSTHCNRICIVVATNEWMIHYNWMHFTFIQLGVLLLDSPLHSSYGTLETAYRYSYNWKLCSLSLSVNDKIGQF